jgi:hypothetical protein
MSGFWLPIPGSLGGLVASYVYEARKDKADGIVRP